MSGKVGIRVLACAGALAFLIAGAGAALKAGAPAGADVILRAKFISGYGLGVMDPQGVPVPNKIENDVENVYYENGPSTTIVLLDDPGREGTFYWSMTTSRRSPRFVNFFFDSVLAPPGTNLSSTCGQDYFLDPGAAVPVGTSWLWLWTGGEIESVPDPADGIPIFIPKANNLNFAAMADGQTAYTYLDRYLFSPADSKLTKYNETRDMYGSADGKWVKVAASDWDGTKVNTWTISPVTDAFKHDDFDPESHEWCIHPEGSIPHMLYSNARLSCNHGTYRMPWQLVVTRLPY